MTLTTYEIRATRPGWGSQAVVTFADSLEEAVTKGTADTFAGPGYSVTIREKLHDPGWIRTYRTLTLDEARAEVGA